MTDTTAAQKAAAAKADPAENRWRKIQISTALVRTGAAIWGLILRPFFFDE